MVRGLAVGRRFPITPLDDREVPSRIELRVKRGAQLERNLPAQAVLDREIRSRDHAPGAEREHPCRDREKEAGRAEVAAEETNELFEAGHAPGSLWVQGGIPYSRAFRARNTGIHD